MSGEMKAVKPPDSETTLNPVVVPVDDKPTKKMSVVHLTQDEKAKSQRTQAFVFDSLVESNLQLVRAIDRLVRVSYVVQTTQLILVIVMLCMALTRR